jgi:hypothetical protein
MAPIQKLFLLLIVIGPLHMGEQILTSIEEFYAIGGLLASYYLWFDPALADRATVMLITFVWTMGSLLMYALLRQGTPPLAVLGMIGVFSAPAGWRVSTRSRHACRGPRQPERLPPEDRACPFTRRTRRGSLSRLMIARLHEDAQHFGGKSETARRRASR